MRNLIVAILGLVTPPVMIAQDAAVGKTDYGGLGTRPDPSRLIFDVNFSTKSGRDVLFENETGSLDLRISNLGGMTAKNVVVRISVPRQPEGLIFDSTMFVGDIAPRDSVFVGYPLSTTVIGSRQDVIFFVEVSDSTGSLVRQPTIVHLDVLDPVTPTPFTWGKNWLLVVGIDTYLKWPELRTPVRDARSMRNVLLEKYGFESSYVLELYDSAATRAAVIRSLEYLVRVVRPQDNLLIYFAGHGVYDNTLGRGYWVPVDADLGSVSGYIPNTDLHTFLAAINSRATLVISDACFSGMLFRQGSEETLWGDILKVAKPKARQALISGGNEPVMDSGVSSEHSIFAYYLLDRLKANQDRYLTAGGLFDRIRTPIRNSSLQTPQCSAIFGTGDEGGEFVFVRRR